jgi:hypothetical protein
MNAAPPLHLIWLCHQPFVVPDDEVAWRIDSTYRPLLDALGERAISFSLGISGGLLDRCARLRPTFIDVLRDAERRGNVCLLGTGAFHPFLPWLSDTSARAQVARDRTIKRELGLGDGDVFWPPELAWSMRVGELAADLEFEAVIVDSGCRDAARMMPRWHETDDGLVPITRVDSPLGTCSKIEIRVGEMGRRRALHLWVRERSLSQALLQILRSDDDSDERLAVVFLEALAEVASGALDPAAPVVVAEDAERLLPKGQARLEALVDALLDTGATFVSSSEFAARPCDRHEPFVPAGTMEGGDAMWTAVVDDLWFRRDLDRLSTAVEAAIDLVQPETPEAVAIADRLLRIQDSTFYFWHHVARTRAAFYSEFAGIERWLRASSPSRRM